MVNCFCKNVGEKMPRKAKRPCSYVGCNKLTTESYCDEHQYLKQINKTESNRYYDLNVRNRRDKKYKEFYHSPEWIRLREYIKAKYKGLCLYSFYIEKKIVVCEIVHHIVSIKEDWSLRLCEDNLIPLSSAVHNKLEALMDKSNEDKERVIKLLRQLKDRFHKEF